MLDAVLIFIALYFLNVAMAIIGLAGARDFFSHIENESDAHVIKVSFSQPWLGSAFVIGLVIGFLEKIWNIDE